MSLSMGAAAVWMMFATVVPADPPRNFKRISITSCLAASARVTVVVHRPNKPPEQKIVTIPKDPEQPIEWPGEWIPETAYISIYSDTRGTLCTKGDDHSHGVLALNFAGCYPAQTVTITTRPPETESSYVRDPATGDKGCGVATPFKETLILPAVKFDVEKLLLQLGSKPPALDRTGLDVGDLIHRAKFSKDETFKHTLRRDGVAHKLSVQRQRGTLAPPTNSPNAIDLEIEKLIFAKLESVTIQVH